MTVPAGNRRICVAYDIEGYSRRDQFAQFDAQERLTELLDAACVDAGLDLRACRFQQQGDGGLALLPTGGDIDDPRALDGFLRSLITGLATVNRLRSDEARVRLRVAVHEGVVFNAAHGYVGSAVVEVFRMCDAAPTRSALVDHQRADLVLVASDTVYRDVLMHGHHSLRGDAFERSELRVKDFSGVGWIHVPGRGTPASAASSTPQPAASPTPASEPPSGAAKGPEGHPVTVVEELFGADGYGI